MSKRFVAVIGCLLIALSTRAILAQKAPVSGDNMGEFDCVIEPKLMLKLGTPETGIIEAVKVDRDQTVKKGEVVARLDSELQRIALDLAQSKASNENDINSEKARLNFRTIAADRAVALASRGNAPTKTADEAMTEKDLADVALSKAELEHSMAQLELANAQARLERRSIRSPVDGVVADVTIKPGEYAYEQAPLMTIGEIDPLYVKVFLPVRHYRKIQVGTVGEVRPEEPIGGVYKAKGTVVDRIFDAASSTFGVRLELPNPNYALPAGMRCRVRFLTKESAANPTTTEAINLPPSQPLPTTSATSAPTTNNQLLATPPVATVSRPATGEPLPVTPLGEAHLATTTDNEPPPTSPTATLSATVTDNRPSSDPPTAALAAPVMGSIPLSIPPAAIPSPPPTGNLSPLTPPDATLSPPAIDSESQLNRPLSYPPAGMLSPTVIDNEPSLNAPGTTLASPATGKIPLPIPRDIRRPPSMARNLEAKSQNLKMKLRQPVSPRP